MSRSPIITTMSVLKVLLFATLLAGCWTFELPSAQDGGLPWFRKSIVNYNYDYFIQQQNQKIQGNITLPDFQIGDMSGAGVTLSNLKTQRRIGDTYAFVSRDLGLSFDIHFSVGILVVQIEDFKYGNQSGNTGFLIKDNVFHFRYTLHATDSCASRMDDLSLRFVDNVLSWSDNPQLNNKDFSKVFQKHVLPFVNRQLSEEPGMAIFNKYIHPCGP